MIDLIEVIIFMVVMMALLTVFVTYPAWTPFNYNLNEKIKLRRILSNEYWVRDNIGWTIQPPNKVGWEMTEEYQDDPEHEFYRLEIEDNRGTKKELRAKAWKHVMSKFKIW